MKIAFYSSSREEIPHKPNAVAANSDVMEAIIKGLVKKHGYDIFLYAPKGSRLKGTKIIDLDLSAHHLDSAMNPADWVKNVYTAHILKYLTAMVYNSQKYDLIHLHTGKLYMAMPFAKISHCPVVITIHQQLDPHEAKILQSFSDAYLISISQAQRKIIPNLSYFANIYHGVDIQKFAFDFKGSADFLFLSRISSEKGVEIAIRACKSTKSKLNIYGPAEKNYLIRAVLSQADKNIHYGGIINSRSEKWYNTFGHAKALLFPIQWEEPFGLVMIEAMATGTPVIAFRRGSVPEIIVDGKTGYLVDPKKADMGIEHAIRKINSLSNSQYQAMRLNCRKHVEQNFTTEKMVEGYEKVYKKILNSKR